MFGPGSESTAPTLTPTPAQPPTVNTVNTNIPPNVNNTSGSLVSVAGFTSLSAVPVPNTSSSVAGFVCAPGSRSLIDPSTLHEFPSSPPTYGSEEEEDNNGLWHIAEASRPWRALEEARPKKSCGRKKLQDYRSSVRINWFNPLLWSQINRAAHQALWNPTETMRLLHQWDYPTFKWLPRWTISRWMEHSQGFRYARWNQSTLDRAERGRPIVRTHRAGVLDKFPEIKEMIVVQLTAIRATGCRITVVGTQAIVSSYVRIHIPDLLLTTQWKISNSWTKDFLHNVMGWSVRRGTTAAQKLPDNWELVSLTLIKRIHTRTNIYLGCHKDMLEICFFDSVLRHSFLFCS